MNKNNKKYTIAGTDIDEVRRLNAQSGLSYNEAKILLAKEYGSSKNIRQKKL